jgi:hypothetical protein
VSFSCSGFEVAVLPETVGNIGSTRSLVHQLNNPQKGDYSIFMLVSTVSSNCAQPCDCGNSLEVVGKHAILQVSTDPILFQGSSTDSSKFICFL